MVILSQAGNLYGKFPLAAEGVGGISRGSAP